MKPRSCEECDKPAVWVCEGAGSVGEPWPDFYLCAACAPKHEKREPPCGGTLRRLKRGK